MMPLEAYFDIFNEQLIRIPLRKTRISQMLTSFVWKESVAPVWFNFRHTVCRYRMITFSLITNTRHCLKIAVIPYRKCL